MFKKTISGLIIVALTVCTAMAILAADKQNKLHYTIYVDNYHLIQTVKLKTTGNESGKYKITYTKTVPGTGKTSKEQSCISSISGAGTVTKRLIVVNGAWYTFYLTPTNDSATKAVANGTVNFKVSYNN